MTTQQIDPSDLPYMEEALALAEQAAREGEVPVGAVVVHEGLVIGVGFNTREHDQDFSAHAELIAMRRAAEVLGSWRLSGCTVYVTLEPCAMCAGAMVQARVSRCVFGAHDPKGGFLGSLGNLHEDVRLNHQFPAQGGVMEEASSLLLKRFFMGLRRR